MRYDETSYRSVASLLGTGLSDRAIARRTGVGRGTVRLWRLSSAPPLAVRRRQALANWRVPDGAPYCYLLGAYLGDGTVVFPTPNAPLLRIVNDRRYPGVSEEILAAMETTFPEGRLRVHPSSAGESDVLCVTVAMESSP